MNERGNYLSSAKKYLHITNLVHVRKDFEVLKNVD